MAKFIRYDTYVSNKFVTYLVAGVSSISILLAIIFRPAWLFLLIFNIFFCLKYVIYDGASFFFPEKKHMKRKNKYAYKGYSIYVLRHIFFIPFWVEAEVQMSFCSLDAFVDYKINYQLEQKEKMEKEKQEFRTVSV